MNELLDNPAWSALTTAQADFAEGGARAKRYRRGVLPFAALGVEDSAAELGVESSAASGVEGSAASGVEGSADLGVEGSAAELDRLIDDGETFYLIGGLPKLTANWVLELELPCAQMIGPEYTGDLPEVKEEIVHLGENDKMEMFGLINAVQPGYYLPDTRLLGSYFGIRVEGRLVAMAGERMRLNGFSELSAIATLPGHTGKGYAQQLILHLIGRQRAAGVMPFLHVSLANQRALRLYEHLGFRHRRDISFFRVKKIAMQ